LKREKSLYILLFFFLMATAKSNSSEPGSAQSPGKWQSIFNQQDLSGWQSKITGHAFAINHHNTFGVENGYLTVSYDKYKQAGDSFEQSFGHLFFMEKLSHYKLRFDYRFIGNQLAGGAKWAYKNSGVMLHAQHPATMAKEQYFPVSIEAQLLGADEGQQRSTANICTPGTIVSIKQQPVKPHCTNSQSKSFAGEQWVHVEIEVRGNQLVNHKVNGELVYQYTDLQLDPKDNDAKALLKAGAQVKLSSGYIALQSESHPIQFKYIDLMQLKTTTDANAFAKN
jgi:hypothetical protein